MNRRIAFFDFDGTITTKDTLLEFIKYSKGRFRFMLGFLWNSPYLLAYKLKVISNQAAKEKVLSFFFKNAPVDSFRQDCIGFTKEVLPSLIRPKAIEEIKKLQSEGFHVVIVSASPENWICHWAESLNLSLMGSQLEVKNGRLTGKICGKNCHGQEKVRRITESYTLSDFEQVFAYGDTSGDKPMLTLAHTSFYKPFR